jgi:hypothetical protein
VDDTGGLDIMDPPDLFSDLYDDDAYEESPRMPQERSQRRGSGAAAPLPRPAPQGGVPALRVKDAGIVLPTDPRMFDALRMADARGDLVTSGAEGYSGDGVHAPTSQHYEGLALDLRLSSDPQRQAMAYREAGYVAIVESDHVHVQRYPRA